MKFIKEHLPKTEYYSEEYKKEQIYLHHTVSSTARSVFNWWPQDGVHVATAYIIDKDGTIYEAFNPKYWSYHLGLKGTNGAIDKKSIGIEIVNEGWLTKKNSVYYWFNGAVIYKDEVIELDNKWRGQKYFAAYTPEQVKAAAILTKFLAYSLNIPFKHIGNLDYNENLAYNFSGILSHCNVRTDKTDVSPAFPMDTFMRNVNILEKNPVLPHGLEGLEDAYGKNT